MNDRSFAFWGTERIVLGANGESRRHLFGNRYPGVDRWFAENQYEVVRAPLEARFRPTEAMLKECDAYAAVAATACT
jgi:hypothetical protein